MKRLLTMLVAVSMALGAFTGIEQPVPTQAAGPPDTFITAWDAIGAQAFTASGLSPAEGHPLFAYAAIAVYDSVVAVKGGYEPFMVEVHAPHASAEAAAVAAARRVFAHFLPNQAAGIIDPGYVTTLARIADGPAKTSGVQVGENVADTVIAMRKDDGFRGPGSYRTPNPPVPGTWIPTAATPPIGMFMPAMQPFSLPSANVFRPAGPPALDSQRWVAEYEEVRDIGGRASAWRTPAQTLAAQFWAEAPVQQARGSFRRFVTDRQLDIMDAARFNAMWSVAYADSLISCFDAKYRFAFWRPVTAVPAGASDGNDGTEGTGTWLPLLAATPNHPEYPSAHSCITPAGGMMAARFLGTSTINFTIPSLTGLGDRFYATAQDLSYEVGEARIWGGIHYRSAVEDGREIARKTVEHVLSDHFRRSSG